MTAEKKDLGNTFSIPEGNWEKFQKLMKTLENKCRKNFCDFTFKITGEEIKSVPVRGADGKFVVKSYTKDMKPIYEETPQKFYNVYVDAEFQINNWECIATVDALPEGNIITSFGKHEIPSRFYNLGCVCEHCNTDRDRKNLYIIYNNSTGDYKQIGKSCLKDFTRGMSASFVAWMMSKWTELESMETYTGSYIEKYFQMEKILLVMAETIRKFGYVKKYDSNGDYNPQNTVDKAGTFHVYLYGSTAYWTPQYKREVKAEMDSVSFNPEAEQNKAYVENALSWLKNQDEENSNWIHNLKVLISSEYTQAKHFSILCSLFPCYDKSLEREAKRAEERKKREAEGKKSEWQGEVKQRLKDIQVESFRCITSGENSFGGMWYLYEFIDVDGNIYKWFASKAITLDDVVKLTGTVKSHDEYKDIKSTMLTRCKVS